MKRNFIQLSFICIFTLFTPATLWANFSYQAEIPKDNKVPNDYLEKRKSLGQEPTGADSWQRQLDQEKAREDADTAKRELDKQTKCEQQKNAPRYRSEKEKQPYQYLDPDPCANQVFIKVF
ncbi:hypothetical protein [Yersinia rohdei]|uniref:hypothetical protein n=1 Tax=Yersinia rohdei TaxID=29485 RepID=UPI00119E5AA7|nr:hypothetical protein [Yersinia rohdei]